MIIMNNHILYISLNNQTLKSNVMDTTSGTMVFNLWDQPIEESYPYSFFLNECLTFDKKSLDKIADMIITDLSQNNDILSYDIYDEYVNKSSNTENLLLQHFATNIWHKYQQYKRNSEGKSITSMIDDFKFYIEYITAEKYSLLDIFAAYDLMPYHSIDRQQKQKILMDERWGIIKWDTSNRMYLDIAPVIKYFISTMKSGGIYLQQCQECNRLFVRTDKRKSIFCKGGYCEFDQNSSDDKYYRYKKKMAMCDYLKTYETTKNYFNQRVKRGTYSAELRDQWGKEARAKKKKVQNNMMPEEAFIKWLNETRQKAICELKESKQI